jgi:hypothetical protein
MSKKHHLLAAAALACLSSLISSGCCHLGGCHGEQCVGGSCATKKHGKSAYAQQFADAGKEKEDEYEGVQASYSEPMSPKRTACQDGSCRHE